MCGIYFKYADYVYAQQRRKTTQNWFLNRGSPWRLQLETSVRGVSPDSFSQPTDLQNSAGCIIRHPTPTSSHTPRPGPGTGDLGLDYHNRPYGPLASNSVPTFFTSTTNLAPLLSASPHILPQSCKSHLYMSYSGGPRQRSHIYAPPLLSSPVYFPWEATAQTECSPQVCAFS